MIRSPRRMAAMEVPVGGHMGTLIFFPFLGVAAATMPAHAQSAGKVATAQTICSYTGTAGADALTR